MASRTISRRQKLLAFGPALAAIGLTAVVASGASIIPGATAASSTVTVNGNVVAGMSVTPDTTSACGGSSTTGVGDFSDGAFRAAASTCTVSFATNSTAGANVTVDDASDTTPFFITGLGDADNNTLDNVTAVAGGTTLGDDQFGIALTGTAGSPLPAAGPNFEIDTTPATQVAGETIWGPIAAAPANICQTTALTDTTQSCTFGFAVDGQGSTQTAGTYSGTLNVLATANP